MAFVVGEIAASVTANSTKFNMAMSQVKAQGAATAISVNQKFTNLSQSMTKVGSTMTKTLTLAFVAIGAASFKMGSDFESEMTKIIGLVGVADEQVGEWSKDLLAMAPKVGKTPKELAEALFFVTSAGLRGAEALDVLEVSAKASAAGLAETKVVADLVTSAVNAYGIQNLSAAKATDILVASVREGKAEASELTASLGQVLPVASEMGVSFDQVGAAVAAMTRTGTNAATASTELRQILMGLLKPSKQAADALNSMGTSSKALREQIKEKGLLSALTTIRSLTNQYGEDIMAQVFPNIRALAGVLDLMGENASENANIFEALGKTTNETAYAFEKASETAAFKLDQTMVQLQVTMLGFYDTLKNAIIPILGKIGEKLGSVTKWFEGLSVEQKENVLKWAAIVAAIGPMLLISAKLITAVQAIGAALMFLGANPIILAIAGVVAAIAGIVYITNKSSNAVKKATEEEIESYKSLAEEKIKSVQESAEAKKALLQSELDTAKSLWAEETENAHAKYKNELDAAEEKTASVLAGLEKEADQIESNHATAIQKIQDEYGTLETVEKSKIEIVTDNFNTRMEQIASEKAEHLASLKEQKEAVIVNYNKQVEEAGKAHAEILTMLDEQLDNQKSRVDRETDLIIGGLEDKISLLEGSSKEEVEIQKRRRIETRAIELEDLIAAETDKTEREALITERENLISGLISDAADVNIETQKWALREEILAAKISSAEKKTNLELANAEEKTITEKALEDKITIYGQDRDAALVILGETEANYITHINTLITEAERQRDANITILKEERAAAITAQVAIRAALKQTNVDAMSDLEATTKKNKAEYDKQLADTITFAENKQKALQNAYEIAEAQEDLNTLNEKLKIEKDLLDKIAVEEAKLAEEENKTFVEKTTGKFSSQVGDSGGKVKGILDTIKPFQTENLPTIGGAKETLSNIGAAIGETASGFWNTIKETTQGIGDNLDTLFNDLPEYALGGIVDAPAGTPVHAIVHGGELITPAGAVAGMNNDSGGVAISGSFNFYGVQNPAEFMQEMRDMIRRHTGRNVYHGS